MAFLIGFGAGLAALWLPGFVDLWIKGFFIGNDFSAIWVGPHLLVSGGDPYDPATFVSASDALGVQHSATAVYIYPGWVTVLLAPFGALDLGTANVLWIVVGVLAAAVGLFALLQAGSAPPLVQGLLGFTLLASEPGVVAFYSGQIDHLVVGGLALMAAWLMTGRLEAAGVAGALAMLLKPQLFALAFPAAAVLGILTARSRFTWALGAAAVALVALSIVVMPQWLGAWLAHVPGRATDLKAATLPNALRDIFGTSGPYVAYALLAASVASALAFGRSRAALPVWLAVSLSVAPYLWVYDHLVGIVPLAMAAVLHGERSARSAVVVTGAGVFVLVVVSMLLHAIPGAAARTLSYNGLAQFALTALIVVTLWPLRKEPAPFGPVRSRG